MSNDKEKLGKGISDLLCLATPCFGATMQPQATHHGTPLDLHEHCLVQPFFHLHVIFLSMSVGHIGVVVKMGIGIKYPYLSSIQYLCRGEVKIWQMCSFVNYCCICSIPDMFMISICSLGGHFQETVISI